MRTYELGNEVYNLTDNEIKDFPPTLAAKILRNNRWYWTVDGGVCYYYIPEWKYSEDLMYLLENKILADRFEEVDKDVIDEMMDKMDE